MLFYILVIVISMTSISLLNIFLNTMGYPWWVYVVATVAFVAAAFIIDALVAIIIRKLPAKAVDYHKKLFQTSDKEIQFFMKIKVNKWKDYIPELGGFTNFHKNKVENPFDNGYIKRFILEACYGIAIHVWSVPASFLILLIDYRMYMGMSNLWLTIGLPVAIINAILIVLPAFILKFNLPRLIRIYENNIRLSQQNHD